MAAIAVDVRKNKTGLLARLLPGLIDEGVRLQTQTTARAVEANIVGAGLIDTGRMVASVRAKMTGPKTGEVTVEAKSDEGFPYPVAQEEGWHDRGGGFHPGNHFVRKAAVAAVPQYPATMRKTVIGGIS